MTSSLGLRCPLWMSFRKLKPGGNQRTCDWENILWWGAVKVIMNPTGWHRLVHSPYEQQAKRPTGFTRRSQTVQIVPLVPTGWHRLVHRPCEQEAKRNDRLHAQRSMVKKSSTCSTLYIHTYVQLPYPPLSTTTFPPSYPSPLSPSSPSPWQRQLWRSRALFR